MTTFQVDDMTCGHCISAITKAVKGVDPSAKVGIDLATADTAELSVAIKEAGYTPAALPAQTKHRGCCCGQG